MRVNKKYRAWHDQIIARARSRELTGYSENHHIKPRSLGGRNSKRNLVRLTYREHFLIHWLLTKMLRRGTAGHSKMLFALYRMAQVNGKKVIVAGWQYEIAKKANADAAKRRPPISEETRRKISEGAKRRPLISEETRRKCRAAGRLAVYRSGIAMKDLPVNDDFHILFVGADGLIYPQQCRATDNRKQSFSFPTPFLESSWALGGAALVSTGGAAPSSFNNFKQGDRT